MEQKDIEKIADAKTEIVNLSDIHPSEYNPRKDLKPGDPDYEALKRSIEDNGYVGLILINKDGTIIGGHQRYKVLRDLGYAKARVLVTDVDKQTEKALNIALNKISGDWDEEKLKEALKDLDLGDFDLSKTGFTDKELANLDIHLDIVDAAEDGFDADSAYDNIETPVTQRGDVWLLGNHRLMCGDATDEEDVAKLMDGQKADLYLTDPPYNVDYTGKTADALKIENDQMEDTAFRGFLCDAFSAAKLVMKGGAAFYIWHADSEGYNFRGACHDIGWTVRECLIWVKNSMVLGRQDYQWQHEPCLYGWNEGGSHAWYSDRKQTTILEFDRPTASKIHPTMKPIRLFNYLIQNSSKRGDIVLDTFGGSGTTIMACEQDDRAGYVMELDPKYCDVIVKRWEEFTGKKAAKEIS